MTNDEAEKLVRRAGFNLNSYLHEVHVRLIAAAMKAEDDNVMRAARRLGLPRTTLMSRLKTMEVK